MTADAGDIAPSDGGPWAWCWLDDSPHGETYAVRDADGIVAYTSRTKAGYERAVRIADEHNAERERGTHG